VITVHIIIKQKAELIDIFMTSGI